MSAISGFWDRCGGVPAPPQCELMIEALRAYGPNVSDVRGTDEIAFGRALYRLFDEDQYDAQPLVGAGGRFLLVADVRLDNREEMLAALGISKCSATQFADSKVVLLAFEKWGEKFLDLINGDFAIGIWDADHRSLLLARDPLGQKPLHYHRGSRFFAFASMPKGLHALAQVERRVSAPRIASFVGLVPPHQESNFYEGVEAVSAGTIVTISRDELSSRRYWALAPEPKRLKSFGECQEAFRAELDRSVRVRLRGAGKVVASQLSGGWDSSSVSATAAQLLAPTGGRVHCYTSVPRRGSEHLSSRTRFSDERELAAETATIHPNIEHRLIEGQARSPVEDLDRYVAAFDRPVYNLCNHVWITDIRRAAGQQGRVLLTGQFGNESISAAPYTILAEYLRQQRWRDWWHEAWALASNGNVRYRGIAANSFGPWVPRTLWNVVRQFSSRPEIGVLSAINPGLVQEIARLLELNSAGLARRPKNYYANAATAMAKSDFGDLKKGALAGWDVDERDPTADRQLVEFCLSLPVDMLLKDGIRRPLARAALSDRVPAAVLNESRKGDQASDWHEGLTAARPQIISLVEDIARNDLAASLIDVDALRAWTRDWPAGGWTTPAVANRYRVALLNAVSAGHFILSVEG